MKRYRAETPRYIPPPMPKIQTAKREVECDKAMHTHCPHCGERIKIDKPEQG